MQVLGDVMSTVAGADDERRLALPSLAVLVLACMNHGPPKIVQRRNVGNKRDAAHACRHHDMARAHVLKRSVGAAQRNSPASLTFVVEAALEFGARPVVELLAVDVSLE